MCLSAFLAGAIAQGGGDHAGVVTFGNLPVPGATVTATRGERRVATVSDGDGLFRLADLGDGTWTVRVDTPGFRPLARDTWSTDRRCR